MNNHLEISRCPFTGEVLLNGYRYRQTPPKPNLSSSRKKGDPYCGKPLDHEARARIKQRQEEFRKEQEEKEAKKKMKKQNRKNKKIKSVKMSDWRKEFDEKYTTDNCEGVREILGKHDHCPHVIPMTCDFIRENPGRYLLSPYSAAAGLPTISVSLDAPGKKTKWLHCENGADCD